MRKSILVILGLAFTIICNAQTQKVATLKSSSVLNDLWNVNYNTVNTVADELFKLTGKNGYIRENYSGKGGYYFVSFYPDEFDRSNNAESISFRFFKAKIGENKDLGIEGQQVFRFSKIEGTFLELLPIWNYIKEQFSLPLDNKESIVEKRQSDFKGVHQDGTQFTYVFSKRSYGGSDNTWNIELMHFIN